MLASEVTLNLAITGRIPSKKNSKRWIQRGSKRFLAPSAEHEAWEQEQLLNLRNVQPVQPPYSIQIIIYAPDRRTADLTNKAESLMDVLVKAGVLTDDNWFVLSNIHLKFGGVDRINPRAEICIAGG